MTAQTKATKLNYLLDKDPVLPAWGLDENLAWKEFKGVRVRSRIVQYAGMPEEIAKKVREIREACPLLPAYAKDATVPCYSSLLSHDFTKGEDGRVLYEAALFVYAGSGTMTSSHESIGEAVMEVLKDYLAVPPEVAHD
jgi:hypothetical protein